MRENRAGEERREKILKRGVNWGWCGNEQKVEGVSLEFNMVLRGPVGLQ